MRRVTCSLTFATFVLLANLSLLASVEAQESTSIAIETRVNIQFDQQDGIDLALDLYLPAVNDGLARPVCLYIHGGGWQGGDKADGAGFLRNPVLEGWIGVSVNYRLSGQTSWPGQIDDIHTCLEWISEHAEELNADPQRIVVSGASAGGHLALIAGLDQAAWRGYRIIGAFSMFGPTDLQATDWDSHNIRYMIVNLLGADPREPDSLARDASPVHYVDAHDVAVLLVHGDADALVPYAQSSSLLSALQHAGTDARLITVPGGNHGNFEETSPDWLEIIREFSEWSRQLAEMSHVAAEKGATDTATSS